MGDGTLETMEAALKNKKVLEETVVLMADAPEELPKCPCYSTLWKYAKYGIRARDGTRRKVSLDYYTIGGRNCTSLEAWARFCCDLHGEDPSPEAFQKMAKLMASRRVANGKG